MIINRKREKRKSRCIDNSEAIDLPRLKKEGGKALVEGSILWRDTRVCGLGAVEVAFAVNNRCVGGRFVAQTILLI